jgi:hypothetical protein
MPSEYGKLEETFSPQALAIIGDWIAERTKKGGSNGRGRAR